MARDLRGVLYLFLSLFQHFSPECLPSYNKVSVYSDIQLRPYLHIGRLDRMQRQALDKAQVSPNPLPLIYSKPFWNAPTISLQYQELAELK